MYTIRSIVFQLNIAQEGHKMISLLHSSQNAFNTICIVHECFWTIDCYSYPYRWLYAVEIVLPQLYCCWKELFRLQSAIRRRMTTTCWWFNATRVVIDNSGFNTSTCCIVLSVPSLLFVGRLLPCQPNLTVPDCNS